jgi:hypothetical protein
MAQNVAALSLGEIQVENDNVRTWRARVGISLHKKLYGCFSVLGDKYTSAQPGRGERLAN